uniref:Uncharacterized protein n=1 Tax=Anopheles atroparvus TaxID=41427 RepID=A0A182IWR6_ANOAO
MFILQKALRFAQTHYDVGDPSKHFCLLRCLDIVSPFMLLQRKRSNLEVAFKTLWLFILFSQLVAVTYDFFHQKDIRAALDVFCMVSLYLSVFIRPACLRNFRSDIGTMERLDTNPRFRVGTPYGDAIRKNIAHKDNLYLGSAIMAHFITITVYVWHNLTHQDSLVTLVTYWPTDLAAVSPTLDRLVQAAYCMTAYVWGWSHGSGQVNVIVFLRMTIAEFRVFLYSLATLDEQIETIQQTDPDVPRERIVCDLLHEHARRHRELIVVMMRLRDMLRIYMLVHFSMYLAIAATFLARMIVITGASSLGLALPLLATLIFFFETLVLCLLMEQLIQLNQKVGFTLYSFDWPRCLPFGNSIKRTVMLMIMQANNPNDFSVGGLTNVSAELFANSCRIIYSMMMCMANLANSGN